MCVVLFFVQVERMGNIRNYISLIFTLNIGYLLLSRTHGHMDIIVKFLVNCEKEEYLCFHLGFFYHVAWFQYQNMVFISFSMKSEQAQIPLPGIHFEREVISNKQLLKEISASLKFVSIFSQWLMLCLNCSGRLKFLIIIERFMTHEIEVLFREG